LVQYMCGMAIDRCKLCVTLLGHFTDLLTSLSTMAQS
jgi:hypothetical protein